MDPKLAEIYGTNQVDEADVEKLAAAELATKLAGEDAEDDAGDTEGMTEEDLEAIAQEVLAPSEEEEAAVEEPETDDAQEKVAEADYLGRVMAHAYVQELGNIEKTAGKLDGAKAAVKGAAGKAWSAVKGAPGKVDKAVQNLGHTVGSKAMRVTKEEAQGMSPAARRAIGYGTVGAGAAAAGGAAYGAKKAFGGKKGKEKKSAAEGELSALDTLVLARANEILEASGIDPASLTEVEKTSSDETVDPREVLAATVEQRAWELLGQYGVTPAEQE